MPCRDRRALSTFKDMWIHAIPTSKDEVVCTWSNLVLGRLNQNHLSAVIRLRIRGSTWEGVRPRCALFLCPPLAPRLFGTPRDSCSQPWQPY